MRRRAQAAIPYLLLFATALLFVLFVFNSYKKTPQSVEEVMTKATNSYLKTATQIIMSP